MTRRPPNLSSYYDQTGRYGANLWSIMLFWTAFVRVLNAIASLATVPVISALLAQGAVVYCQRRNIKQRLNLRQTFALADRGWTDIAILWDALPWSHSSGSMFLWLAAGLLFVGIIQVPIQQAFVGTENIIIMTCADSPEPTIQYSDSCNATKYRNVLSSLPQSHGLADTLPGSSYSHMVGYDPEPIDLAETPQNMIVQQVIKKLATVDARDPQQHLWPESGMLIYNDSWRQDTDSLANTLEWFHDPKDTPVLKDEQTYFVAAIPNNTVTGILREHAIRLNSSVTCEDIATESFPVQCEGSRPFVTSYDRTGNMSLKICVPGDYTVSPWSLSRDRQDIEEHFFIQAKVYYIDDVQRFREYTNWTTPKTTRGYFELGNVRNGFQAGLLLDKWPDIATLTENFNDYLNKHQGYSDLDDNHNMPSTVDTYEDSIAGTGDHGEGWVIGTSPFTAWDVPTPGPLMTSALAMFGNESFFYVAANSSEQSYPPASSQICQAGNIPFSRYRLLRSDAEYGWLSACTDINSSSNRVTNGHWLDEMIYNSTVVFNNICVASTGHCSSDSDPYTGYYNSASEALSVAMFFANEALLTRTATQTSEERARIIYTSPGSQVIRPFMTTGAMIAVSVLVSLQVLGLGILALYIYTVPTWTTKLDSYAIAQLTKDMDGNTVAAIGRDVEGSLKKFRDIDGLVGLVEQDVENAAPESPPSRYLRKNSSSVSHDMTYRSISDPGGSERSEEGQTFFDLNSDLVVATESYHLARGAAGIITSCHAPPETESSCGLVRFHFRRLLYYYCS
ncbi:hypothetical protein LTR37_004141 [Vermiconidia calcicola]|uniref:Uncharacterized protein n=1 Tax=Vermiconidia calcicola TaxID=1690605 RepID=A0ACC3NMC9_9PEZI|nr:hypothetical protein LTR37_004141 [Vermiconidia calcicola]